VVDFSKADSFTQADLNPTFVCSGDERRHLRHTLDFTRDSNNNKWRRSLIEERSAEKDNAIAWGKKELTRNRATQSSFARNIFQPDDVEYMEDQLIFVMYFKADGSIAGIAVTQQS